jgi:hypothetical protein
MRPTLIIRPTLITIVIAILVIAAANAVRALTRLDTYIDTEKVYVEGEEYLSTEKVRYYYTVKRVKQRCPFTKDRVIAETRLPVDPGYLYKEKAD